MKSVLKPGIILLTALLTVTVGVIGIEIFSQWNETSLLDVPTESNPQTAAAFLERGELELKTQNLITARADFEKAYSLSKEPDTLASYAHFLMTQSDFENAEKILSSATSSSQKLLYQKALFNVLQQHPEKAEQEFKEASLEVGPINKAVLQNFLDTYKNFAAAKDAESYYLDALLCKSLVDAEEFELAGLLARSVLNQKNDYRDVWVLLGYSQMQLKKFEDAEASLKQAKTIDSIKPEVHYFLGSIFLEEKKFSEAVSELELAILYEFKPAEEAYKKMAAAHEGAQQWQEAVADYEALLSLSTTSSDVFRKAVTICLTHLNDPARALTLAQKISSLFPNDALGPTLLAQIALNQGDLTTAESQLQTAFNKDANAPFTHFVSGLLKEAQKNTDGAKWAYKKAFELTAENEDLHSEAAQKYNALLSSDSPQP